MDFGALPPEVNSAKMYSGPGSAPLLAAAAGWSSLATELNYAATGYDSVIADLSDSAWQGPSAEAMAAAANPYAAWLKSAASGAEQTARQATSAASAYEAAYAATVPPPVIAANRTLLTSLVATNFLGQNAPAIAATEAHYGQMWAQDAAAMYAYAATSATSSTLVPLSSPPPTTNGSGQTSQSAAATSAAQSAAGSQAQSAVSNLITQIPSLLQNLTANSVIKQVLDDYQAILNTLTSLISTANGPYGINLASSLRSVYQMSISIPSVASALGSVGTTLNPKPIIGTLAPLLSSPLLTGSYTGPAAAAGTLGRAGVVGSLSVPANWASSVPAVKTATVALQVEALQAIPAVAVNSEGVLAGQMALSSLAGRALGTPVRQAAGAGATRAIGAITHVTNKPTAPDVATTATVIVIPPIPK